MTRKSQRVSQNRRKNTSIVNSDSREPSETDGDLYLSDQGSFILEDNSPQDLKDNSTERDNSSSNYMSDGSEGPEECIFCKSNIFETCHKCTAKCCERCRDKMIKLSGTTDRKRFVYSSKHYLCFYCTNLDSKIDLILSWKLTENKDKIYLIKWPGKSYHNIYWVLEKWLEVTSKEKLRNFKKKVGDGDLLDASNFKVKEEFLEPDLVLQVNRDGPKSHQSNISINEVNTVLVKWQGLPYSAVTWEDYHDLPAPLKRKVEPLAYKYLKTLSIVSSDGNRVFKPIFEEFTKQPKYISGGELFPYQLDGLNWLYYQWTKKKPSILADEMGLGKTIQIISFLYILYKEHKVYPSLVIVPKAVISNWHREFSKWAPELAVAVFAGEKESLDVIAKSNLFQKTHFRAHVLLTTYETFNFNVKVFGPYYPYETVILDEGQRLKSAHSVTFTQLNKIQAVHKILVTGTPLQNNITELFTLMSYMDPKSFGDKDAFMQKYESLEENSVVSLHDTLKPYFLRRTKLEVLKDLPKKSEVVVPVSMTSVQREVYKAALSRNIKLLASVAPGKRIHNQSNKRTGLTNLFMDLRKCLNHPYLIDGVEETENVTNEDEINQRLIDASGKLKVLHRILKLLKKQGHRVLLFSQFKIVLDIIEDYLDYVGYKYLRIDGETTSENRQTYIDEYNKDSSDYFIFLLSTRAGGVGLNLSTADTVVIYDMDFNPQSDLQALSRAHRIGQKNQVLVLRLVTRESIEERMLEIAKEKLVLDDLIIQKMGEKDLKPKDIESVIRFGAKALFEEGEIKEIKYSDEELEALLDRNAVEEPERAENGQGSASFGFAKIWNRASNEEDDTASKEETEDDSHAFWEGLIEARLAEARQEEEKLGRGARVRTTRFNNPMKYVDNPSDDNDSQRGNKRKRSEGEKNQARNGKDSKDEDYVYNSENDIDVFDEAHIDQDEFNLSPHDLQSTSSLAQHRQHKAKIMKSKLSENISGQAPIDSIYQQPGTSSYIHPRLSKSQTIGPESANNFTPQTTSIQSHIQVNEAKDPSILQEFDSFSNLSDALMYWSSINIESQTILLYNHAVSILRQRNPSMLPTAEMIIGCELNFIRRMSSYAQSQNMDQPQRFLQLHLDLIMNKPLEKLGRIRRFQAIGKSQAEIRRLQSYKYKCGLCDTTHLTECPLHRHGHEVLKVLADLDKPKYFERKFYQFVNEWHSKQETLFPFVGHPPSQKILMTKIPSQDVNYFPQKAQPVPRVSGTRLSKSTDPVPHSNANISPFHSNTQISSNHEHQMQTRNIYYVHDLKSGHTMQPSDPSNLSPTQQLNHNVQNNPSAQQSQTINASSYKMAQVPSNHQRNDSAKPSQAPLNSNIIGSMDINRNDKEKLTIIDLTSNSSNSSPAQLEEAAPEPSRLEKNLSITKDGEHSNQATQGDELILSEGTDILEENVINNAVLTEKVPTTEENEEYKGDGCIKDRNQRQIYTKLREHLKTHSQIQEKNHFQKHGSNQAQLLAPGFLQGCSQPQAKKQAQGSNSSKSPMPSQSQRYGQVQGHSHLQASNYPEAQVHIQAYAQSYPLAQGCHPNHTQNYPPPRGYLPSHIQNYPPPRGYPPMHIQSYPHHQGYPHHNHTQSYPPPQGYPLSYSQSHTRPQGPSYPQYHAYAQNQMQYTNHPQARTQAHMHQGHPSFQGQYHLHCSSGSPCLPEHRKTKSLSVEQGHSPPNLQGPQVYADPNQPMSLNSSPAQDSRRYFILNNSQMRKGHQPSGSQFHSRAYSQMRPIRPRPPNQYSNFYHSSQAQSNSAHASMLSNPSQSSVPLNANSIVSSFATQNPSARQYSDPYVQDILSSGAPFFRPTSIAREQDVNNPNSEVYLQNSSKEIGRENQATNPSPPQQNLVGIRSDNPWLSVYQAQMAAHKLIQQQGLPTVPGQHETLKTVYKSLINYQPKSDKGEKVEIVLVEMPTGNQASTINEEASVSSTLLVSETLPSSIIEEGSEN